MDNQAPILDPTCWECVNCDWETLFLRETNWRKGNCTGVLLWQDARVYVCVFVCYGGVMTQESIGLPEWLLEDALSHWTWSVGASLRSSKRAASSLTSSLVFIKAELMAPISKDLVFNVTHLVPWFRLAISQLSKETHLRAKSTYPKPILVIYQIPQETL
jgi:hypothetical protein